MMQEKCYNIQLVICATLAELRAKTEKTAVTLLLLLLLFIIFLFAFCTKTYFLCFVIQPIRHEVCCYHGDPIISCSRSVNHLFSISVFLFPLHHGTEKNYMAVNGKRQILFLFFSNFLPCLHV